MILRVSRNGGQALVTPRWRLLLRSGIPRRNNAPSPCYARECAGNSISLSARAPATESAGEGIKTILAQLHLDFVFAQSSYSAGLAFTLTVPCYMVE